MRHSKARDVNRASATIYGNLISLVVCAPAFVGAMRRGISAVDFGCIAYLGIVQLGLAYLLFTSAMARGVRSIDASIIGYVEPVLNPVWVFLFIGERPSGWAMTGGAIIIASVIIHLLIATRAKADRRVTPELKAHE
jgi:drug/metabolite transporter (DMT)-like permease